MKQSKDNFSRQSVAYCRFRPTYPPELYEWLFEQVDGFSLAWDCGTGNGQAALRLAERFEKVYASDISQNQLEQAGRKENIEYLLCRAEQTPLLSGSLDLICVAQAIHWFDFNAFYREVKRVAKPGALLAVWGYGLIQISSEAGPVLQKLYSHTLGAYWDAERKYIDEDYQSIPFPFPEVKAPVFKIVCYWTREQLTGYLGSWSAVQHYISEKGISPLADFEEEMDRFWQKGEVKEVHFPVFMRVGKVDK
ncbi:class I SAM-dependent methyltransferase [Nafulsella turpanensis]|uniref:class I SAM-dependent methyltransferase n=1 Tax=Nafulsella turpanensis TaxID=1265690 RepID=UPI0003485A21|nr:class I SAM-dependent methyltransferase [Nafulsella turpanensis]